MTERPQDPRNAVRERALPGTRPVASAALARRLAAVDLLQRALETALGEDGLQAALQRFLLSFSRSGEAHALEVGLLDPTGRELRVVAGVGNERAAGSTLDARHGLCGRLLGERGWVLAPALELDPATPLRLRGALVIGFPLEWAGQVRGALAAWVPPGRTAPDDTVEALRMAALCLSLLLEQAEGRAQEHHRAARFELISQVARLIGSDTDLHALLQRAADAIHSTLGFPAVDIPLIEADAPDCLTVRIRGGHYKREIRQVDRIPIDRGIMGAAVREQRTQCVNDVAADPRYIKPPNVDPPRAELAVPILLDGLVLGVINVESPRAFAALDLTSLELVAECLAVAIRDARRMLEGHDSALLAERERIAGLLQARIGESLTAVHMLADTLESTWRSDPDKAQARTRRLREASQSALAALRALLRELLPPAGAG